MDTSGRSLGNQGALLIAIRVTPAEGVAMHAARVGTEVARGKLPTEGAETRIHFNAGLFEAPFQLFYDFVQVFSHGRLPSTRKQEHAQTQGSSVWKPETESRADSNR